VILIVGAGIAGLSLAWELTKLGHSVKVIDANDVAAGASGIATSYLEPRLGMTAMRALEWQAMQMWPQWSDELQETSGVDVGIEDKGQIKVAFESDLVRFERDMRQLTTQLDAQGLTFERLTPQEVVEREPSLTNDVVAGAFLPHVRWVNGRNVCRALALAISNAGGEICPGWQVARVINEANGVTLIDENQNRISADQVVFATGLGSNNILGVPSDFGTCRSVRGVNLVLDSSKLESAITHHIKHHRGNICPRRGNRLLVGTTYEPDETSTEVTADVVETLYKNAEPILPLVRKLPLVEVTCGLRSKIGDGKLHMGRSEENPALYFSLSHSGAGFLRAPIVAREFAKFITEDRSGNLLPLSG